MTQFIFFFFFISFNFKTHAAASIEGLTIETNELLKKFNEKLMETHQFAKSSRAIYRELHKRKNLSKIDKDTIRKAEKANLKLMEDTEIAIKKLKTF